MLDLTTPLGHGTDGTVWRTARKTAVKALQLEKNYRTELECYQRFKQRRVTTLDGFAVPELVGYDDALMIVEMRIVTAPFILDFAKAWLDRPADYADDPDKMADWHAQGEDLFEGRWSEVLSLLGALKRFGIYYYDAKPGNIKFAE